MRFFTLTCILVILCSSLKSQNLSNQLLSTAGQVSQNQNIRLEWSLGEIATSTLQSNNDIYTQGFHQPSLIKRTFDDKINTDNVANIEVWPNPTQNYLNVNMQSSKDNGMILALFDINGKRLKNIEIEGKESQFTLNLEKLLPGFYYLKIYNSEGILIDHQKVVKSL